MDYFNHCVNCHKKCGKSWCDHCYQMFSPQERWYLIGWKKAYDFPFPTLNSDSKYFEHYGMYLMGCADRLGIPDE